jgi:hypothetical protein
MRWGEVRRRIAGAASAFWWQLPPHRFDYFASNFPTVRKSKYLIRRSFMSLRGTIESMSP